MMAATSSSPSNLDQCVAAVRQRCIAGLTANVEHRRLAGHTVDRDTVEFGHKAAGGRPAVASTQRRKTILKPWIDRGLIGDRLSSRIWTAICGRVAASQAEQLVGDRAGFTPAGLGNCPYGPGTYGQDRIEEANRRAAPYPPATHPSGIRPAGRRGPIRRDHLRRARIEDTVADPRRPRGAGCHPAGGDPGDRPPRRQQVDHGNLSGDGAPTSQPVFNKPPPVGPPQMSGGVRPIGDSIGVRVNCRSRPARRRWSAFSDDQNPNLIDAVGVDTRWRG